MAGHHSKPLESGPSGENPRGRSTEADREEGEKGPTEGSGTPGETEAARVKKRFAWHTKEKKSLALARGVSLKVFFLVHVQGLETTETGTGEIPY